VSPAKDGPDLWDIRGRHPDWWIDWSAEGGYQARSKRESHWLLKADTEEKLDHKIRTALLGAVAPEPVPDELSRLKGKYPRYWILPISAGYLAVPHGISPVYAQTIEEMDTRLGVPR
jgi:hypothetical protein